ncbi:BnaCnng14340D [Brassica napus]|uniref:BnaCnng14340D protein n=1 Tax=Brassica napus TaxID=3708 RepID=A0A078IA30_BRANA|nr:BnaCnng14340D [Brassica napus]
MTKRQRGRLYASKNKPKSPITVTHDSPSFLRVHAVVIISACETISDFARKKQRSLCILNVNGCVTNVTLRQPASSGAKVTTAWDHWFDHQRQVGGGLIASGHVVLMAASFMNVVFDRLPQDDDEAASMRNQQYYQNGRSHPIDNIHGLPQNMLTNGNSGIVSMLCC